MVDNPCIDNGHTPQVYKYTPITGSGWARVLDLHKSRFDDLECSITQINLEDGGYQALSYEWGKQEQLFQVLIRGTEHEELGYIPLTKNLFDALKDLRDCPDIESKRFWIDQICINQEDEKKKGIKSGLWQISTATLRECLRILALN
jgi:Heterokaryon incompatibility protein (HET)